MITEGYLARHHMGRRGDGWVPWFHAGDNPRLVGFSMRRTCGESWAATLALPSREALSMTRRSSASPPDASTTDLTHRARYSPAL
jgi:hypothetical protein